MNEKNLQLDSISLAEEVAFISWVKNGTDDKEWQLWLKKHPDQKEKVADSKKLVNSLRFKESNISIDTAKLWNRIENSTDAKEIILDQSTTKVKTMWRRSFIGIAASVAVLLTAVYFMSDTVNITTSNGENLVYTLPDNSKISINAGSELSFDKNRWESNRVVNLEGEAFFEVEKGSKFTVKTSNGEIQVLGTKFNVFSRDQSLEVKCTEGRVQVTAKGSQEILNAGDVVALSDQSLEKIPFQAKIDWRQNSYSYRAESLGHVFDEIERQFEVEINTTEEIKTMLYSGALETKELKKAIYMVTWPMGLDFKINGKSVEIVKK